MTLGGVVGDVHYSSAARTCCRSSFEDFQHFEPRTVSSVDIWPQGCIPENRRLQFIAYYHKIVQYYYDSTDRVICMSCPVNKINTAVCSTMHLI